MTHDIDHELRSAIAMLRTAIDTINDIRGKLAPAGDRRLNVPWIGQNVDSVATDDYTKSDCGAAVLAMMIGYTGRAVTVDEVSRATGRPAGYASLSFQELINAAARFNVLLTYAQLTLDEICADVASGKPVIVVVNYKSLPAQNRYDAKYNAGHYLLVVGYDAECITYHDPYWQTADRGAFRALTREDFARAYTTVAPGNTRSSHALRMTTV